jgi:hypothetical protein
VIQESCALFKAFLLVVDRYDSTGLATLPPTLASRSRSMDTLACRLYALAGLLGAGAGGAFRLRLQNAPRKMAQSHCSLTIGTTPPPPHHTQTDKRPSTTRPRQAIRDGGAAAAGAAGR